MSAARPARKLVPYLATALPRISHDRRTYRLTLRDGLRYSNGTRVKASDFRKAVERDFLLDSAGAAFFRNIVGADAFARVQKGHIRGIVVDNAARTIVIHLKAAAGRLLERARLGVRRAGARGRAGRGHVASPAARNRAVRDQELPAEVADLEERNPYFQAWRFHGAVPAGNPDSVTWDIVTNASVALRRVLSGKDDWMSYYQIPDKRLPTIEQKHKWRLKFSTPPNLMYFFMNTRVPPFTSLKVRRAVNLRDLAPLAQASRGWPRPHDREHPAAGLPLLPAHSLYRHDLRKAIRLVRESGYRGKRVFVWNHDVPADLPYTEYLVSVLNRIGFHAAEKVVTAGSYWTTLGNEKVAGPDRLRELGPGLSAPARLVQAPRRPDDHADAQLELRELRRRLGEPRDRRR